MALAPDPVGAVTVSTEGHQAAGDSRGGLPWPGCSPDVLWAAQQRRAGPKETLCQCPTGERS